MSLVERVDGSVAKKEGDEQALPELVVREMRPEDSDEVKQFCLNVLMQRARLSNQYVYRSPVWLAMFLTSIAWASQHMRPWVTNDWGRWAFLCCSLSALFLVGVDYFTYRHYEARTERELKEDPFLQSPKRTLSSGSDRCWVAFYNDGLVGTVVLRRSDPKSSSAELCHWYTRARYREKGLGTDLLTEAVRYAQSAGCSSIATRTSTINVRANKSLQKFGFRKASAEPDKNTYWRLLRMRDFTWTLNPQTAKVGETLDSGETTD